MPTDAVITARVEARNAADVVHRLACDEAVNHVGDAALEFWKRALANVCAVLPPEYHPTRVVERGPTAAMTNDEARAFEGELAPFDKWKNRLIGEVPLAFWDWLDAQPDFRKQLNRYLRNPRIEREERENEEPNE